VEKKNNGNECEGKHFDGEEVSTFCPVDCTETLGIENSIKYFGWSLIIQMTVPFDRSQAEYSPQLPVQSTGQNVLTSSPSKCLPSHSLPLFFFSTLTEYLNGVSETCQFQGFFY
jgi:hypothetical protein